VADVRFEQATRVYPNADIAPVDRLDLRIEDGELMVLVGPSGSGKTTALRMLAGLEEVDAGAIYIGDRDVSDLAPKRRDIAMVFQNYALYPHMTVAQNLAFGLSLRHTPRAETETRVREAAQMLDLAEVLDRKPAQLSGGQRQRVALGRALVRKPAVFLLDEPLSNLDAKLRLGTRVEIAKLHRKLGATMIYVTHDQIEAMTLGRRIVVMNSGEIQQIDTPMQLYQKPANVFVAGFVGSPAMNFFRGQVLDDGDMKIGSTVLRVGSSANISKLASLAGRELVVGLRPEDLTMPTETPTDAPTLAAKLEVIEPVGNEIFLNLRYEDRALVARIPPQPLPEIGSVLKLGVRTAGLHLFDAKTEKRIDAAP